MIGFTIHTMNKEDKTPLEFTKDDAVVEGSITDAVIMESGMQSGKTSVTFKIVVDLPEPAGRVIILAQTSAALIDGLNSAIKGNEARWRENNGH